MVKGRSTEVSDGYEPAIEGEGDPSLVPTPDVASYVAEMLDGLRVLTGEPGRKDLQFLDYLLALAANEATTLASHNYH